MLSPTAAQPRRASLPAFRSRSSENLLTAANSHTGHMLGDADSGRRASEAKRQALRGRQAVEATCLAFIVLTMVLLA